jgi:DNA-binding HxlR family transcriptional regulator
MPRRKINVKKRIIQAFNQKNVLTWTELLSLSQLSKGALSQHLNELIDQQIIRVKIEQDKRRRPKATYVLNNELLHQPYETSLYKEIMKICKVM